MDKLHFRIKQTAEDCFVTQQLKNKKWVPVRWHYDAKAFVKGDPVTHTRLDFAKHDLVWCCPLTHDLSRAEWDCKVIDLKGKELKEESLGFDTEEKKEEKKPERPKLDHSTRELFVCDCQDIHHQFVVNIDPDPGWQMVTFEVMLNRNLGFFKRIWAGLKYIFSGKPSRFGYFDEIIIRKSDADRLQKVVDAVRKYAED